jgi:hypothetical protein
VIDSGNIVWIKETTSIESSAELFLFCYLSLSWQILAHVYQVKVHLTFCAAQIYSV